MILDGYDGELWFCGGGDCQPRRTELLTYHGEWDFGRQGQPACLEVAG